MQVTPLAGGMVNVAGREFYVRELSLEGERSLVVQIRLRIKAANGKGGYFAKCKDVLQYLKDAGMTSEFQLMVSELSRMEANGDLPVGDTIEAYRQTAEGVALELFARTRDTHPEVTLNDFGLIVTEANALDVHLQIVRALTEGKSNKGGPANAG